MKASADSFTDCLFVLKNAQNGGNNMRAAQELNSLALKTRRAWGEDAYSPVDIFAVVNGLKDKKITGVKYPLSNRISGMCTK